MNRRNTLYMQKAAIAACSLSGSAVSSASGFSFFLCVADGCRPEPVPSPDIHASGSSQRRCVKYPFSGCTSLSSAERLSSLSTHPGTFSGVAGLPFTYAASV